MYNWEGQAARRTDHTSDKCDTVMPVVLCQLAWWVTSSEQSILAGSSTSWQHGTYHISEQSLSNYNIKWGYLGNGPSWQVSETNAAS